MRSVDKGAWPTRSDGHQKLYQGYGDIRIDLISRIGEYCCYCEVPLGVNLAVEHILSKNNAVNYVDWNNSLLACTNCNSHKGDKTRDEPDLNNYYWPSNAYTAPFNTFNMLQYVYQPMTPSALIAAGVLQLPANRRNQPYVNNTYNMVWVFVNPAYVGQAQETSIKRTINLTGLNDCVPDDEKMSDRRVANRTAAWNRAVIAANYLFTFFQPYNTQYAAATPAQQANIITAAGNDFAIGLLNKQIKALVMATGFWSVWITVFQDPSRTFINDTVRAALICELFIKTFPGTRLPYNGIAACP
jgi:hypothetical protein